MIIIHANSAATAFINASQWLIENGKKNKGLTEELNAVIEIDCFEHGSFEREFDQEFRRIFGDERIDFASSVTFIEPTKSSNASSNDQSIYEYTTIKPGWKNSYWGRMISWEDNINQIENVISILKKGQNTKRCQIVIWHPTFDRRKMFGQPCLLSIDFKPRDGDLYMTANFRSQRITKSGYADYSALIALGQFLADECNLTLKRVTNIAHSLHLGGSENNELSNTKTILEIFSGASHE